MATMGQGVTVGSHSLRAVRVRRKGEGWVVSDVFADRLTEEVRPVAGRALAARGFKGPAYVGLSGRDVIIRYSQVPPVPDWRLRLLMQYEVDEVSGQSGGDVAADYRKLDLPDPEGTRAEDTILVALARNAYLERQIASVRAGGLSVAGACPNSVALFNCFAVNATYSENETSLLVNVGAADVDIAIQHGGELIFARNATPGGRAFTEAIMQAFSTTESKAEQLKIAKADVTPRGQARYPDPTAEKVANAIMGVAGQLASLIQSTLMIARAQTKLPDLKVDRVLLAGGGASLKGLDRYLHQAMGVKVERMDPFAESDLSELSAEERALAERAPHEFAVAMGLAQMSLAPGTFRLSLLPAALERRRRIVQQGAWAAGAALAAVAILAVIYGTRSDEAAAAQRMEAQVRSEINKAHAEDDKVRKALEARQAWEVKHHLLADRAESGVLLATALAVLERALLSHREVYLDKVDLRIEQESNEFGWWQASKDPASGYQESMRRFGSVRAPVVRVVGRVSAAQNPVQAFQRFVQQVQADADGLLVETARGYTAPRPREDGSFELTMLAGVRLRLVTAEGAETGSILLRQACRSGTGDDVAVVGLREDGVEMRVPRARIERRDWDAIASKLSACGGDRDTEE